MKLWRSLSVPLLLIVMLGQEPASVSARTSMLSSRQAEGSSVFTFADLGEGDLTVRLIYDQLFVDFPLSGGQQVQSATLHLHMQHSPDLLPQVSDLMIALNDEPVVDIILSPENAADSTTAIDLPVGALKTGRNELLLRFSMRLVENGCRDVGDSALWATVFKDSSIHLSTQELGAAPDLDRFPTPFSTYTAVAGGPQVSILLPPTPTPAELSAAARIAASLGQEAGWQDPPLTAYLSDQADKDRLSADSLIAITTGERNPLATTNRPGLTLAASPYNQNQLLLVVAGSNDQELEQAAAMLVTRSARSVLKGSHVDPIPVEAQRDTPRPTRFTLADLGIQTKRVRGIGLHDLYYPIDVPYNWKTTSEASAEIHFTHGPAMTSASLLTAYINGFETENVRLTYQNDDDGRLVIQLSPRQLHPGRNWLHLIFDLHMPREDCSFRYFEEAWAEVSAEKSLINLAHVVSSAPLDLRYLPSHLIVPEDLSADVFVLPSTPTNADLTAMVRTAAKLGTYSQADSFGIRATSAGLFAPQLDSTHLIVIGTAENNAIIKQNDAALPQPLTRVGGRVLPSAGRAVLPDELSGQAAYLEVLPAPWSRFDSLLILSADSSDLLLRLVDILPAGGRRFREQGSVAVVTATDVTGFAVGTLEGESLSASNRVLVAAILVGAFVLILGVGALVLVRLRRARPEADHE